MPTILVVDDHEEIREALAEILEEEGHKVVQAVDGLDALEAITASRPDVILLDIAMPGMDGLETLRRLKDRPDCATLPVIMVTAQGDRPRLLVDGGGGEVTLGDARERAAVARPRNRAGVRLPFEATRPR